MTSAFTLSQSEVVAPVSAQERSESLDVLRGAAVLGILLMNILIRKNGRKKRSVSNPIRKGSKRI
jgi:uncharacterized membrane protein YeiB